jgi:hypothetical protein
LIRVPSLAIQLPLCVLMLQTSHPSPRWETHDLRVVLQGGGIYVSNGTVSIVNSQVYSNQAANVRAHALKSSHRPDGKMADVLAPIHACTTANASVNYRWCVPQKPCKFPIAPMGKWLTCLPRLTLAPQLRTHRSTIQWVRATEILENFPSPRWENG